MPDLHFNLQSHVHKINTLTLQEILESTYMKMSSTYTANAAVCQTVFSARLTDGQVRIIRLKHGDWNGDIECCLETVDISSRTSYQALSWCWGILAPETDPFLVLNTLRFQIPMNLEVALRHLRMCDQDRFLWCDAM